VISPEISHTDWLYVRSEVVKVLNSSPTALAHAERLMAAGVIDIRGILNTRDVLQDFQVLQAPDAVPGSITNGINSIYVSSGDFERGDKVFFEGSRWVVESVTRLPGQSRDRLLIKPWKEEK